MHEPAVHVHLGRLEAGIEDDGAEGGLVGDPDRERLAGAVAVVLGPARGIGDAEVAFGDLLAEDSVKDVLDHRLRLLN